MATTKAAVRTIRVTGNWCDGWYATVVRTDTGNEVRGFGPFHSRACPKAEAFQAAWDWCERNDVAVDWDHNPYCGRGE